MTKEKPEYACPYPECKAKGLQFTTEELKAKHIRLAHIQKKEKK